MHTFKGKWSVVYLNILKRIKEQGEILAKNKCIFNLNFEISPDDILILKEKNWKWALVELFDRFNPQYVNPGFCKDKYHSWWLVLVDQIAHGLDENEKEEVKSIVKKNIFWDRIIVLDSWSGKKLLEI